MVEESNVANHSLVKEALFNLLNRFRIGESRQSVGGPIDVAHQPHPRIVADTQTYRDVSACSRSSDGYGTSRQHVSIDQGAWRRRKGQAALWQYEGRHGRRAFINRQFELYFV